MIRRGLSCGLVAMFVLALAWPARGGTLGLEGGLDGPTATESWSMGAINPLTPPTGAVVLPHSVPEYHWWLGCSPTAAGMLFAYWDTYLGASNLYTFHDGNSAYWDKVHMNKDSQNDYGRDGVAPSRATHSIVASWGHRQAGSAQGLTYGTWDRNGNDILDDSASWDSLADFMLTENGGTYRSKMAGGFVGYALWDDPGTVASESYAATAWTKYIPSYGGDLDFATYKAEIDAGYPVHVGIPGHSILGFGYYYDQAGAPHVINWTTWGGSWDGLWGDIEWSEVYGATFLRIDTSEVPLPSAALLGLALLGGLGLFRRVRRTRRL